MLNTDPESGDNRNERVAIPLDPEEALRALLQVAPGSERVERERAKPTSRSQRPKLA